MDENFHGLGKHVWQNGETYEGEWKGGKMDGKGKKTYQNGSEYIGDRVENNI